MEEIAVKRTVYSWHAQYKVTLGEAYEDFWKG